MTCDSALAERLIEITSKPLLNYNKNRIITSHDPYYGYADSDSTTRHKFVWDISPYKRLVLICEDNDTLAPGDAYIKSFSVIYHIGKFSFAKSSLNYKTFPATVLSTIIQFAWDGIPEFIKKQQISNERYNLMLAEKACRHAIKVLS